MGLSRLQCVIALSVSLGAVSARAAIPAGYLGEPFDPAVVGGAGIIPPTVKAGPYALPGRVDFVNYDMGGDGVGYHTDAHYTTKDGDGYRTDRPTATLSLTGPTKPDLFYDTGTASLDGTAYPATGQDFYVGSVHPGDWFNYTVDVKTAGTYTLSANFSTGNGPPGGEGGDGQMELDISVNGTKMATWHTILPDFADKANFHNWKPYPAFATLTLEAGVQVIKFQAPYKHLNLDYVDYELVGADGGAPATGDASATGAGGATGAAGSGTTSGAAGASATGAAGAGAAGASATGAAGDTATGAAGGGAAGDSATGAAGATVTGAAGSGATGAAGAGPKPPGASKSGGCAVAASSRGSVTGGALLALALVLARRSRRRRR